jgi:hypothetical protein
VLLAATAVESPATVVRALHWAALAAHVHAVVEVVSSLLLQVLLLLVHLMCLVHVVRLCCRVHLRGRTAHARPCHRHLN